MRRFLSFLARVFGRGRRLEEKLDAVIAIQEKTMSKLDDLISDFNTETTNIGQRMDKLLAEVAASGQAPTPDQLAALSAISDRLKALGSDPAAPIPTDPTPAAPVAPDTAPSTT